MERTKFPLEIQFKDAKARLQQATRRDQLIIIVADLIMADGKSLEKTGVTPDETGLPTGEDLFAKRDPVLVRAAEMLAVK